MSFCQCTNVHLNTQRVVVTGGPGAGKTAVLELARKQVCEHVAVLPEAASVVFGGGFWRLDSMSARMASQRAIYYVERELEAVVLGEKKWALALCDRGTLDGLAYWPEKEHLYWEALQTTKELEFQKYAAVIHLRTPSLENGYNHENPLRIETVHQAAKIDERIATIWGDHPSYQQIPSTVSFMDKANRALSLILKQVPECCRSSATEKMSP